MNGLGRIEKAAWLIGVLLVVATGLVDSVNMAIATALGALFTSLNFRLLVWSWTGYMDSQVALRLAQQGAEEEAPEVLDAVPPEPKEQTESGIFANMGVLPRFAIKYAFLLIGIFVLVGGVRLHLVGCLIGMGNVIIAAGLSPILLKLGSNAARTETN